MINFDYSALLSMYQLKSGSGSAGNATGTPAKKGPTAPWSAAAKPPEPSERLKAGLSGKPILDVAGAKAKLPKSEEDFAELFALYNALDTLKALAGRKDVKGLSTTEQSLIDRRFTQGMAEVSAFVDEVDFEKLRMVRGAVSESTRSAVAFKRTQSEYKTGVVHTGAADAPVSSLQGDVRFSMTVKLDSLTTKTIDFDLAEMGDQTRNMGSVVNYLNGKLKDAGALTRFAREKLPSQPRTVQAGSTTVTLPDAPERWGLKIAGVATEPLSFAAPDTADAVYLAQASGKAGAQSRLISKFQTDVATGAPPPAAQVSGEADWVEGRVFSRAVDADVTAIRASATHTDGSVYMLAEIEGAVSNQTIKGERDVALLKYDAAGALIFSQTLGAASAANASAIAVSADGTVAIGGSVKGALTGGDGADTRNLDSFVTVLNADGEELWTRRGGSMADDDVRALTFGADGTLYVSGQTKGPLVTNAAIGGADAWLRAYKTVDKVAADGSKTPEPKLLFSTQYGTTGEDAPSAIAVENNVLVAGGVENGRAVLRRFDLAPGFDPVQSAIQDLGALQGGSLAGVALSGGRVTVAGSTVNGALNAANTLSAHSGGGQDVFVLSLDDTLASNSSTLSYWGGLGNEQVSAVAMKGSQVYVAGSSTGDIGDLKALGAKDGFVARFDPAGAAPSWARRFTGRDGEVAPTALSVGSGQASVLDRLGLPAGAIDYTGSQLVTAATSARVGDRFYLKAGASGRETAITIEAKDTLKSLAAKMTRALGLNGTATVSRDLRAGAADGTSESSFTSAERLLIKPRSDRSAIEIRAGEENRDLLEALGLQEGVVRLIKRDNKGKEVAPREGKVYGLKLPRELPIGSKADAAATFKKLDDAMTMVQTIYRDLTRVDTPAKPAITGEAPAYLKAQLANYQAGLARLGG